MKANDLSAIDGFLRKTLAEGAGEDDDFWNRTRTHTTLRRNATATMKTNEEDCFDWKTQDRRKKKKNDDDDDDDDYRHAPETESRENERDLFSEGQKRDSDLKTQYPEPKTVERQRKAEERVKEALRKLKFEERSEHTPELFQKKSLSERRSARNDIVIASTTAPTATARREFKFVNEFDREHFLKTPESSKKRTSPLGPARRVMVENNNGNSPNLIQFSPITIQNTPRRVTIGNERSITTPLRSEKKNNFSTTPPLSSSLGPARRVMKSDQENALLSPPLSSRRNESMFNTPPPLHYTPEVKIYPTPEVIQTQSRLKKNLLERLAKIAAAESEKQLASARL